MPPTTVKGQLPGFVAPESTPMANILSLKKFFADFYFLRTSAVFIGRA